MLDTRGKFCLYDFHNIISPGSVDEVTSIPPHTERKVEGHRDTWVLLLTLTITYIADKYKKSFYDEI